MTDNTFASVTPETILPNYFQDYVGYIDMDPIELARQFTLIQFEIFNNIPIVEFHGQKWNKEDVTLAPNVRKAIRRFNEALTSPLPPMSFILPSPYALTLLAPSLP